MSVQEIPKRSPGELRELERQRTFLLIVFVVQAVVFILSRMVEQSVRKAPGETGLALLALLVFALCVVFFALSMYGAFRLARSLGRKIPAATVYALLMFSLLFGLISYLTLAREVTQLVEAGNAPEDKSASQEPAPTAEDPAGGSGK